MTIAIAQARATTLALLARRRADATVCPSEVARTLAKARGTPTDWRDAMPIVHAAVDDLLATGEVGLRWKGVVLPARSGPYRIGTATDDRRVPRD